MSELVLVGYGAKGDPIYKDVPSQDELVSQLKQTAEWKEFRDRFDMSSESNTRLLGFLFKTKLMLAYSGDDPTLEDYQRLLRNVVRAGGVVALPTIKNPEGTVLLEAGQYEFELRPVEPEPQPEPEVPRDRNGNPLTSSQLLWRSFAIWANDPNTSSEMIRQRRLTDRSFAEFYRRSLENEMAETPTTQFQIAGLPSSQVTASDKLQRFAKLYNETSTDRLKPRGGYITLSDEFKLTKPQFDNFVSQAVDAGIL